MTPWLGVVVARTANDVERAVLGLDHDEYGVEHVVFDGRGGTLLRVHHVYAVAKGADARINRLVDCLVRRGRR